MEIRRLLLGLFASAVAVGSASAKVPVNINSGTPVFPFPQFKEYKVGTTLGKSQPEGVSHAEMEKDIRGAYQLFANEWEYTGEEWDGVKYIRGNIGCPYDCSEGDGYSLLAAAYMADKVSFDGLWMRIHDVRRAGQPKYVDGELVRESGYGYNILSDSNISCSATDGDMDIALALYVAWKQWGDNSGHKAFNGDEISYKKELFDVVAGLAETHTRFPNENPRRVTSGDIGLDGYMKNGTTWAETTSWASQKENYLTFEVDSIIYRPEYAGPVNGHTDYLAPAYLYEFYKLLEDNVVCEQNDFVKSQFLRATASSDWVIGSWLEQNEKYLPYSETYTIDEKTNKVTLEPGNQGGRFRSVWRTTLNYLWHGNPDYSWNPNTHSVESKPNEYEKTACERVSAYVSNPQKWSGEECTEFGGGPDVRYTGPATITWDVQPDGSYDANKYSMFTLNWVQGVSTPSAVATNDKDLLAKMYRQCVMEYDIKEDSVPYYFNGWFRLLGMLTATGNFSAPSDMDYAVNVKVYKEGNTTVCYAGDEITYTISVRNYGSLAQKEIIVRDSIPAGFEVVSIDNYGTQKGGYIEWTTALGGRIDDSNEGTTAEFSYTLRAKEDAEGVNRTSASVIYGKDNEVSFSSPYPNNITSTFQQNAITVLPKRHQISKEASKTEVFVGDTLEYTLRFSNVDKDNEYLVGGRKDVNVSVGMTEKASDNMHYLYMRLWHDAQEQLINYGNYRVSYFTNNANELKWSQMVYEGGKERIGVSTFSQNNITNGYDSIPAMQKISVRFENAEAVTTAHLSNYLGAGGLRIHEGDTYYPLRVSGYLYDSNFNTLDFSNDWSWDSNLKSAADGNYYPVSPRYTELGNKDAVQPLNEYIPSVCQASETVAENYLVEEWDGYAWRIIQGNAPTVGKDINDVVVADTLPEGFEFLDLILADSVKNSVLKLDTVNNKIVVRWSAPALTANKEIVIKYTVKAGDNAMLGANTSLTTMHSAEGADGLLNSINVLDATDIETSVSNSAIVSPNPTSSEWTILRDCNYSLVNIAGVVVEQGKASAGDKIGARLPSGVYLFKTNQNRTEVLLKK